MKIKNHAVLVAIGIFLSRIAGLIRERVFAHYFGSSDAGDAFKAALKIPNFLQNLFGEGVLSASFIPVYAKLLAEKHEEEASHVASVVLSVLFILVSVLVLLGVLLSPVFIDLVAPGFIGEKRNLTIFIVQIFFPGTGLLVLSAWCLGVLNSHKKFFLSYVAPVVWNVAIIATMILFKNYLTPEASQNQLAIYTAWGLVLGSFLQFSVQFPFAFKLLKKLYFSINLKNNYVQVIFKNFSSVFVSRGVVQLSAYIDMMIASLLQSGSVSALAYAQTLYLLPVSLFGMSVSASELPQMSQAVGTTEEIQSYLVKRLNNSMMRVAFFVVPSVVAFFILGKFIVQLVFQTGAFTEQTTNFVWLVLCGSSVGLLASTLGRLYSSGFYALQDAKTPLKFALVRVFLTTVLGLLFSLYLPKWLGLDQGLFGYTTEWGACGLTASAGISGWVEFYLLRKNLNQRIGETKLPLSYQIKLWVASVLSAIVAIGVLKQFLSIHNIYIESISILCLYGVMFFVFTYFLKISFSRDIINKIKNKF